MAERYLILHKVDLKPPPPTFRSSEPPWLRLPLESVELDEREAVELMARQEVEGLAPVMPLARHEPVHPLQIEPRIDENCSWGVRAVGADRCAEKGTGIAVAVLDSGIDVEHPAFADMPLECENFTASDDIDDQDGHGTHCAGTLAGQAVDGFRIGVAPGVGRLLIGKVAAERRANTQSLLDGIEWAVSRFASVISISLSIDFPGHVENLTRTGYHPRVATSRALEGYRHTLALFDSLMAFINNAAKLKWHTPLVVAAAGNDSERSASAPILISTSPPASANGVLSVGALRLDRSAEKLRVADFSNIGADVVAPGVSVTSAVPTRIGTLGTLDGTSMAAPHAAGVAALWAERLQVLRRRQQIDLVDLVRGSATVAGISSDDIPSSYGLGMVTAPPPPSAGSGLSEPE